MRITVVCIGKTSAAYVREGVSIYLKRLQHYAQVDWLELPDVTVKGGTSIQVKQREGETILKQLKPDDFLTLLDERGKSYTSTAWAQWLQQRMNASVKHVVLVIGGAHGFSEEVYARANAQLSLSAMTFPHELIRLFLAEQLYRAHTILKGEKYHHE